jgi:hypothetical protein
MLKKPKKNIVLPDAISVGITWVSGKCIFKPETKWSQFYYGICHYSKRIWAITPLDYQNATLITTIQISELSKICSKSRSCFDFKCPLNRFTRNDYINEFVDVGAFSLSLPNNIESLDEIWFNAGEYRNFWKNFIIPISGGVLKYKDNE